MKKINYVFAFVAAALIFTSCGKDGAVGPVGPAGTTGPTGAVGTAGPTGATGTANVIYSDWTTPPTYTKTTVFGSTQFSANIAASKITQAILDNGTVLVYGKLDGYITTIWPTAQVSQLPIVITYDSNSTAQIDTWSALATVGNIEITLVNNTNVYGSISTAHQFRYVIIPGGVHTLASINTKDYNQVKMALHLKD